MTRSIKKSLVILPLLCCLTLAHSHPYSLTFCRMYLSEDHVIANLTVPVEDLVLFQYLGLDSTRTYSLEEIHRAGMAYQEELTHSLLLQSEHGHLQLESLHFHLQSHDKPEVAWADLLKYRLEYTFTYKQDTGAKTLMISQNFGEKFPLIPAMMVLELEGKSVPAQQLDLIKGKVYSLAMTPEKEAIIPTSIVIDLRDTMATGRLQLQANQWTSILGENYVERTDGDLLDQLLEIKMNGMSLPLTSVQWQPDEQTLTFSFPGSAAPNVSFELHWKSFNRILRTIPVELQGQDHQESFQLNRFKDAIHWEW